MNPIILRRCAGNLFVICSLIGTISLQAEGNAPIWTLTEPIPFEEQPDTSGLGIYERAELSASQQQLVKAREEYSQAYSQNPANHRIREAYAWFLYANGFHDKETLRLLEQCLLDGDCTDPAAIFNATVELRDELGLPATPLKNPPGLPHHLAPPRRILHVKTDTVPGADKNPVKTPMEEVEHFQHWTFAPYYDYSFFNHGRQGWQEEDATLVYQFNQRFALGGEVDVMERPPSGTNTYYSALASYYLWKWLEVHGKYSICPAPTFAALNIYSGGFIYQASPKLGLLLDYQRYNFIQGPIDQINPGLVYNFTDQTSIAFRYVRGWAFYNLEYNYYSTALNVGLPGNRKLTMAFAYGTDPDSEVGANGNNISTLSPAYTYSLFFTQPITKDISIFTGAQYCYRLTQSGAPLYQQFTPTIGCIWKF
jgi:hypothetical protein